MTPEQFKIRWESDASGGGITFDDIAFCAQLWGLYSTPRTSEISKVRYDVLKHANTNDAHDFKPTVNEETGEEIKG